MKLLIIPWYNYQMKYVNKYVKEYIKLGIKKENIDIFEYKNPYTIRDAYKIYKTNTIQNKKYDIIHTFSGGSLVLGFLRMSDNYNFDKVIFDSGPMFPTNRCTCNYLTNLYNIPKIFENTLHNIVSKNRILHLNNEEKQFMFQIENNFENNGKLESAIDSTKYDGDLYLECEYTSYRDVSVNVFSLEPKKEVKTPPTIEESTEIFKRIFN